MTDLLTAVSDANLPRVQALIEAGADPNDADEHGLSALHIAVLRNAPDIVTALLAAKAKHNTKTTEMLASIVRRDTRIMRPASATFFLPKPNERIGLERAFDKGSHPLHLAASLGFVACASALLDGKARPTSKDGVGATPLHLAALGGHTELVVRLLETKADVNAVTKTRKSLRFFDVGSTPIHAALESGVPKIVEALLAKGADLTACTKAGNSALFFAARGGDLPSLEHVLAAGVPLTAAAETTNFPLLEAVDRGHHAMVARLLELGEASETPRGHQSPLYRAIERNDLQMRQTLLDGGARPLPDHGLISAARNNDTTYLRDFLAAGKNPDTPERGATALMSAAAKGHLSSVRVLIDGGADVNAGEAMLWALDNRHFDIVDALLDAGVDTSKADAHGNTALHKAIRMKQPNYLQRIGRIIAAGANPHTLSRSGLSAHEMAKTIDIPGLAALLEGSTAGDAEDHSFKTVTQSTVLRDTPATYTWQKVSAALWDELVPPSGPAESVQGEVIRCIGKLTDEAYRNGNGNWSDRHRDMVTYLEDTLLDATFEETRRDALRTQIRKLRNHRALDLSGNGSPHYLVSEAAVDWCLAHRTLKAR